MIPFRRSAATCRAPQPVWASLIALLLALIAAPAPAQSPPVAAPARTPILVARFAGIQAAADAVTEALRAALVRTGRFQLVPAGSFPLGYNDPIAFEAFDDKGAELLLVGSVVAGDDGRLEIRARLYDIRRREPLAGVGNSSGSDDLLLLAHRLADQVWQTHTGTPGLHATRIAYVVRHEGRNRLVVTDWDGRNSQVALDSPEPVISPAWSPDGRLLAYVSFEERAARVLVQSLGAGTRSSLLDIAAPNSAPAFAPDGAQLAVVVARDGVSGIHLVKPDGSHLVPLVEGSGIDTEPVFSPDGEHIYFISDRGGSPQIYRVARLGGEAQRITTQGEFNVSPAVSPDGTLLAYVSRSGERFELMLMDLATRRSVVLHAADLEQSPCFAPNGQYVLHAAESQGRSLLSFLPIGTRAPARQIEVQGEITGLACGPAAR